MVQGTTNEPDVAAVIARAAGAAATVVDRHDASGTHRTAYVIRRRADATDATPAAVFDDATPRRLASAGPESISLPLLRDVESVSVAAIRRTIGVAFGPDETATRGELRRRLQVPPQYTALFNAWVDALAHCGDLDADGEGLRVHSVRPAAADASWDALRERARGAGAMIDYLRRCADALPSLLRGDQNPLELLFPDGRSDVAESIYKLNPVSQWVNAMAAETVAALVRGRGTHQAFRVLEIGAGTGGTTDALLPVLPPASTTYVFSDVSRFFTARARQRYADAYPFVRVAGLDINEAGGPWSGVADEFDLIVAANVLHDAVDVGAALARIRRWLHPAGTLLLVEATTSAAWQLISIRFLEGLNAFGDDRRAANTPFLGVEAWQACLELAGLEDVRMYPDRGSPWTEYGAHVIVARRPGQPERTRVRIWDQLAAEVSPRDWPDELKLVDELPVGVPAVSLERTPPTLPPTSASGRERQILSVLSAILGREVQPHENFFDAGADSLQLIHAREQLSQALGRDLTLIELYSFPNAAALAAHEAKADRGDETSIGETRAQLRQTHLARRTRRPPA